MNLTTHTERETQDKVIELFTQQMGYRYLGNWKDRDDNSNVEEEILSDYLLGRGYSQVQVSKALEALKRQVNNYNASLYEVNQNVYDLLRYGVKVKEEAGENYETVHLFDWKNPGKNDFAIAEEVTVKGERVKRPDLVLYVNGIAIGVMELKRSSVSIEQGIRQNIANQDEKFIKQFFATVQIIMAGNETQGLRYGTIKTPEKYYLKWKEGGEEPGRTLLEKYLMKLCNKERLLELMYDFVLFDQGMKKLPRAHQYFAIKAAQDHVRRRQGGVIWHTQGSGKSIVMVLLGRWILENNPNARVAVITDRDELDKQIEGVFKAAGEKIQRTGSGRELMELLGRPNVRIMCSLIHKFGQKGVKNFKEFIREVKDNPPEVPGELFVFVDECHRTQSAKKDDVESAKLHRTMKAVLPHAVFIGFTGTPLLKKDKMTSQEVFGSYIHTYKFNEAVEDGVILDLAYEARDIDQRISSPEKVDKWFKAKTRGLNEYRVDRLKERWGTLQKVLSSKSRMDMVVKDIILDFNTVPRLSSGRGNAMLVASSIFDACRYYELFQKTEMKGKCAVVTSYVPNIQDITKEDTGANTETDKQFIYNVYEEMLEGKQPETFENKARKKFVEEPGNMKLLIVVDKLLVGFDAPSCTYLYIDKSMQDHGLFQAICRVNRLDDESKPLGQIVDYKDLFMKVENAVAVYTSEIDHGDFEEKECEVVLQDHLEKAKEKLDNTLEQLGSLCEPVEPPRGIAEYIRYFCGNSENPEDIKEREPRRAWLYKLVVSMFRAYTSVSSAMEEAGYSKGDISRIKGQVKFYLNLRGEIKLASGENIDLKAYEADMRYMIDNYISAEESRKISEFDGLSLLEIIENSGILIAIQNMPNNVKQDKGAVAETIENNVRSRIIKEYSIDPAFYGEMSELLTEIINDRKAKAVSYEEYLKKLQTVAQQVKRGRSFNTPASLRTPAQIALYNNLGKDEKLALEIDSAVRQVKRPDWRGSIPKQNEIKRSLYKVLGSEERVEEVFDIVKQQSEY